jgi:hypothetical protein
MAFTPIPDFPGYWLDKAGNVYSGKEQRSPGGQAQGFRTVNHLAPIRRLKRSVTRRYAHVGLFRKGRMATKRVHILMLETFIGPRPPGFVARHLNGNSLDNRIANLEWSTPRTNIEDIDRHGTRVMGERVHTARLAEVDVKRIRTMQLHRGDIERLAHEYGVSRSTIDAIRRGITWKHVTPRTARPADLRKRRHRA